MLFNIRHSSVGNEIRTVPLSGNHAQTLDRERTRRALLRVLCQRPTADEIDEIDEMYVYLRRVLARTSDEKGLLPGGFVFRCFLFAAICIAHHSGRRVDLVSPRAGALLVRTDGHQGQREAEGSGTKPESRVVYNPYRNGREGFVRRSIDNRGLEPFFYETVIQGFEMRCSPLFSGARQVNSARRRPDYARSDGTWACPLRRDPRNSRSLAADHPPFVCFAGKRGTCGSRGFRRLVQEAGRTNKAPGDELASAKGDAGNEVNAPGEWSATRGKIPARALTAGDGC